MPSLDRLILARVLGAACVAGCGGAPGEVYAQRASSESPAEVDASPTASQDRRQSLNLVQRAFEGGRVYATTLPDWDAMIAIAVGPEGRFDAYVCGDSTFDTHSTWLCGDLLPRASIGTVAIGSEPGWTLRATVEADAVRGAIESPGEAAIEFVALAASEGSLTNIYENGDVGCRTGVIAIEEPGQEPQFAGTWCAPGGLFGQVTPLRPVDLAAETLRVLAETPAGPKELFVSPLVP